VLAIAGVAGVTRADALYERAPTHYSRTDPDTPLTRLAAAIDDGASHLRQASGRAVLVELLDLLDIPVESQVLVYSKTSAQNSRISPATPRAIYFSDKAYIGWVQGGEIEAMTFDERLGAIFHLVKLTGRASGQGPEFLRDASCLNCHAGSANRGIPGGLVRSVFPSASGLPIFQAGTFHIDDSSPVEQRWGGWYVTGDADGEEHLGNRIASESGSGAIETEKIVPGPVERLDDWIDPAPYLGGGTSDIVALMVLEHQVAVHNTLTRANLTARQTLHRHRVMREQFGESPSAPLSDTNRRILDNLADEIVARLVFRDEFPLEGNGVEGDSAFEEAFHREARIASDGRSLRDLRLYERLFKYRCSFLIYSDPFLHLPGALKSRVWERLAAGFTSPVAPPAFDHLGDRERERIVAILADTHPEWPIPVVPEG